MTSNVQSSSTVSLCMLVRNEERTLPRCLDSVHGLSDEIVIVDTGSTDATRAVAARYGARVLPFDFTETDFAAGRNHGLNHATGQWILMLDADETLDPSSRHLIPRLAARGENAGYYFHRLNRREGSERANTDYVVRLFPNRPSHRYRGRVHETIDASITGGGGKLLRSEIRIHHDFAADEAERRRKNLWYIAILHQEIVANPGDVSRLDFLAAEYHQLGMYDQAAEITERIVLLRRNDPEAHLRAGVYHLLYKEDRERAAAELLEALRLRPGYPEALSFLRLMKSGKPVPTAFAGPPGQG